jgi:hypothetical protein
LDVKFKALRAKYYADLEEWESRMIREGNLDIVRKKVLQKMNLNLPLTRAQRALKNRTDKILAQQQRLKSRKIQLLKRMRLIQTSSIVKTALRIEAKRKRKETKIAEANSTQTNQNTE